MDKQDSQAVQDNQTQAKQTGVVSLQQPIKRETDDITQITLRKPKAGELRGVKLVDLLQMDVDAISKLLPRIAEPVITQHEINSLDPADFTDLSLEVVGFFNKDASPSA